ncbi:unnamed protein product [Larinioides sclopetarius]|uniref:SHSP domain-containing protein n=1 Tax=Larinioides sclopetarius TaxID=280406 RepID=A0AAV2B8I6_9ARAC
MMHKFDSVEEGAMFDLLERMTSRMYSWPVEEPFSQKIGFQRFGLQLREEDFEQVGVSYRDFLLRDRNEVRKASSGFSEINYDENEFKVDLDVWPFKCSELNILHVPGKYISIKGEHEGRFEDGSECSRKFQRYYRLPKGSSQFLECSYCKGILTIIVDRKGVLDEDRKPHIVPITLITCRENKGIPVEDEYNPALTTEVQELPIANDDLGNNKEPDVEATKSPKRVPISNEDSRRDNDVVAKIDETLKEVLIANCDLGSEAVMSVLKNYREVLLSREDSKSNKKVVQVTKESVGESITANENSNVDSCIEDDKQKLDVEIQADQQDNQVLISDDGK